MVATALGEVSPDEVWRVLRRHGIHLRRRRSWCISTDPEFAPKAADIIGLYLAPPANAIVISVDEKPHIQALERAKGYLRLPNGTALRGFSHEYKRHGTSTLFAALNIATGQLTAGHYARRRRREFLDFMNDVVAGYPDQELHIVLDNLNTHKPKHDHWLARHPRVHPLHPHAGQLAQSNRVLVQYPQHSPRCRSCARHRPLRQDLQCARHSGASAWCIPSGSSIVTPICQLAPVVRDINLLAVVSVRRAKRASQNGRRRFSSTRMAGPPCWRRR